MEYSTFRHNLRYHAVLYEKPLCPYGVGLLALIGFPTLRLVHYYFIFIT